MSGCRYERLSGVKPPALPGIREVLGEASIVLREKRFDPSRYKGRGDLAYWVLRFIGADVIPLGECGGPITLEELGFYRFTDYDPYSVARDPLDLVLAGKPTPLVALRLERRGGPRLWAKLEWYNPYSLSVKDRVAWQLVKLILEGGELSSYEGMVEVSSSNTGIALASLSALLGVNFKVVLPSHASIENERILRLLGAGIERVCGGITWELVEEVKRMAAGQRLYNPDQYSNDGNILAHLRFTARELIVQLRHAGVKPSKLILVSGTSGTASAVSFALTNYYNEEPPETVIVVPAPGEKIEGIRRLESGVKWLDMIGVDYMVEEVTRREALEGMRIAARANGVIPGVSGGAVFAVAKRLRERGVISGGDEVITIIPDSGFKYPEAVKAALGAPGEG